MGESRRRRQLNPTYCQMTQEDAYILAFFGQAWFLRHSRFQRRQAYQDMQVFLQTLTCDDIKEVMTQWQSTSPRPPFVYVLIDYVENCQYEPIVLMEVDDYGRYVEVLPLPLFQI